MVRSIARVAAAALVLAAGCQKVRDEYTLNPDGSGKVAVRRLAPAQPNLTGGGELDPQAESAKAARKLVEGSKGVEAWKDLTWKVAADGRILLVGTAYFKNVAGLKLEGWRVQVARTPAGGLVLGFVKSGKKAAKAPPRKLAGKDLERRVLQEKMKWQQGRGMMVAMLSGLEFETVVHLPGKVGEASCFKKLPDGKSVRLVLKGDDFLKLMDQQAAREEFWKKQATEGRGRLDEMEVPEVMEKLFGSREPPRAVVEKVGKPLFDYAKEVAAARAADAALRKKLGAGAGGGAPAGPGPSVAAPKAGAGFKKLWVKQVQHQPELDLPKDRGLFPARAGCQVQLIGELPGPVLKVENGAVERAVADTGADLLPATEFQRKTQGAYLTGKNKGFAQFTVGLAPLPAGARGLKEISGHITYVVGTGSKQVDLGEIEIKKGAEGKALGAKVRSINPGFKSFDLQLKVDSPSAVRSFKFAGADGKQLDVNRSGYRGWKGKYTFSFRCKAAPPAKAKVTVELYEKTEKRKLPFSIRNLSLRGEPLAK